MTSGFAEDSPSATAAWGMLLQFPFYAGIFGIITGTGVSDAMAVFFVRTSTPAAFPALVFAYSTTLGMFVPSGGAKWMIEAPYVIQAAKTLGVSSGWMVVTYNLGESVTNFFQQFWMVTVLGLLGLVHGTSWVIPTSSAWCSSPSACCSSRGYSRCPER